MAIGKTNAQVNSSTQALTSGQIVFAYRYTFISVSGVRKHWSYAPYASYDSATGAHTILTSCKCRIRIFGRGTYGADKTRYNVTGALTITNNGSNNVSYNTTITDSGKTTTYSSSFTLQAGAVINFAPVSYGSASYEAELGIIVDIT